MPDGSTGPALPDVRLGHLTEQYYRAQRSEAEAALAALPDHESRLIAFDAARAVVRSLPEALAGASPERLQQLLALTVERVERPTARWSGWRGVPRSARSLPARRARLTTRGLGGCAPGRTRTPNTNAAFWTSPSRWVEAGLPAPRALHPVSRRDQRIGCETWSTTIATARTSASSRPGATSAPYESRGRLVRSRPLLRLQPAPGRRHLAALARATRKARARGRITIRSGRVPARLVAEDRRRSP